MRLRTLNLYQSINSGAKALCFIARNKAMLSFVVPLMIFGGAEAVIAILLLLPVSCCAGSAIPCLCAASLHLLRKICCSVALCAVQEQPEEASASPAKLSVCPVTRPPGPAAPLFPACNLALQTDTHGGRQDCRDDNSCCAICTAGGYLQHCWLPSACGYHLSSWEGAFPVALLWLTFCLSWRLLVWPLGP